MFDEFDPSKLTPNQLQQLLALSTMDEQSTALDDQLAQARALQQAQSGGHRTELAAGLGGLGDAFRALGGLNKERTALAEKQELLGKKQQARELFGKLMFGGGGGAPAGHSLEVPSAPVPFGYAPVAEEQVPNSPMPFAFGYSPGMWRR